MKKSTKIEIKDIKEAKLKKTKEPKAED